MGKEIPDGTKAAIDFNKKFGEAKTDDEKLILQSRFAQEMGKFGDTKDPKSYGERAEFVNKLAELNPKNFQVTESAILNAVNPGRFSPTEVSVCGRNYEMPKAQYESRTGGVGREAGTNTNTEKPVDEYGVGGAGSINRNIPRDR